MLRKLLLLALAIALLRALLQLSDETEPDLPDAGRSLFFLEGFAFASHQAT